jgi:uncharacterized protein
MPNLSQIVGFEWDDGNSLKSADKHAVSQTEAEQVFTDEQVLVADDARHSQDEERYNAMGRTNEGRLLHVTFTLREHRTKIRVISARDAGRKERRIYEQKA